MRLRTATKDDLQAIVALLADDVLGATRERLEDPLPAAYVEAFDAIERQSGNRIIVAVDDNDDVMGCLQLTLTPGLARHGMMRATIEAVRIARNHRNTGLGEQMFRFAIDEAKKAGCGLVQLTTDRTRPDAHRFYERLGFEPSHIGMKLNL
ncbi:MAG: GNAT family N-acetyltransferase [Pseudomonadota bacterium]